MPAPDVNPVDRGRRHAHWRSQFTRAACGERPLFMAAAEAAERLAKSPILVSRVAVGAWGRQRCGRPKSRSRSVASLTSSRASPPTRARAQTRWDSLGLEPKW